MDETTTQKLEKILAGIRKTEEMDSYLETPKVKDAGTSMLDYFRSLPEVRKLPDTDLIKRSGIEKSYYYQIMKGSKNPSRDKVLRLCIGAGLSLRETTRMLELSGFPPLYPKNKRDVILTVVINQGAGVDEANLLLYDYKEEPLS